MEREGITGGGQIVSAGDWLLIFIRIIPMIVAVADARARLFRRTVGRFGELIVFGICGLPDPNKRGEMTAKDMPTEAYHIAIVKNCGTQLSFKSPCS
jgi:hypothetical protein